MASALRWLEKARHGASVLGGFLRKNASPAVKCCGQLSNLAVVLFYDSYLASSEPRLTTPTLVLRRSFALRMRAQMLQILLAAPLAAALSLPSQMHRATMRSAPAPAASFSPIQMVVDATVDADAEPCDISSDVSDLKCGPQVNTKAPFKKVMAANRAEIAVRIMRAATELNMETVAIYGYEDRYSQHRWGADQSFMLKPAETAVKAYLDVEQVISIAKENGVVTAAAAPPSNLLQTGPAAAAPPGATAAAPCHPAIRRTSSARGRFGRMRSTRATASSRSPRSWRRRIPTTTA